MGELEACQELQQFLVLLELQVLQVNHQLLWKVSCRLVNNLHSRCNRATQSWWRRTGTFPSSRWTPTTSVIVILCCLHFCTGGSRSSCFNLSCLMCDQRFLNFTVFPQNVP